MCALACDSQRTQLGPLGAYDDWGYRNSLKRLGNCWADFRCGSEGIMRYRLTVTAPSVVRDSPNT